jgi:hypothetical protein
MMIVLDSTCSGSQKALSFPARGNYGPALRVCTCDLRCTFVDTGAYGPMCAHGSDVPLLSVLTLIHYIIIMKIMIEKEHKDLVGRTHFGAKQSILLSPRIHNF